MNDAMDQLLREAIRTRRLIRFRYKDQERIAEPHDYGIQNGIVRLFCYQVAGYSSGRLPGWRLVNVSEMRDCKILEKKFAGNRETPSGTHHKWDEVFIRVAPPGS
jgi:WYL domain